MTRFPIRTHLSGAVALTLTIALGSTPAGTLAGRILGQAKRVPLPSATVTVAQLIASGKKVYDTNGCGGCHAIAGKGGSAGPDLTKTGAKPGHTEKWFEEQIVNPKSHNPSSAMPAFDKLAPRDLTAIAVYMTSLGGTPKLPAGAAAVSVAPAAKAPAFAPPNPLVVAKIEKTGAAVRQVAQNDPRVEVDYHLQGASVTDAALVPLTGAQGIYELHLGRTGVTDAGLAHLKGLSGLEKLHLEETKITDRGLANLSGMKNLTYLNLYGTGITDAGLQSLANLKNLQHLYVWQTKVTPAGIEALKKALPKVEVVSGWSTADTKPAETKKP